MHSVQPLEILADELGTTAGRIERELRLKDEARAAQFEARLAAIELAAFKAEEERQRKFEARLAELRDGKDGEPGRDGKDADIEPLVKRVQTVEELSVQHMDLLSKELTDKVDFKLAEVKDGEPGKDADITILWDEFEHKFSKIDENVKTLIDQVNSKLAEVKDGKDADIEPLKQDLEAFKERQFGWLQSLEKVLDEKVEARLAEVKDGKDGEPGQDGKDGKDADIGPLREEIKDAYAALKKDAEEKIERLLSTVRDGNDGKDGEPGPPGKDGKDGKLPIAREWTNRVHYAGDVVRHTGATYQALADTGHEPPHSDWGELASRGTDAIGFVLRGTYDATAEYKQHDIVMLNRNSFAAKYDTPGECPGDGWQLFAPSGGRGKEGAIGTKGSDGKSVSIVNMEADADAMALRITDSLGKTFTLDLEPIAERIIEAAR